MLNGDSGNLGIGQTLGDKHDTESDAADNVLDEPFRMVVRKPLGNRELLDDVVDSGGGQTLLDGLNP